EQLRKPWVPGESGNPKGRPLGSRNKLSEKFILALHDDFEEHGSAVIAQVRQERPEIYLKVIASLVPRELHFKSANAFAGMSDDELTSLLVDVIRSLAGRAGESISMGESTANVGSKHSSLHLLHESKIRACRPESANCRAAREGRARRGGPTHVVGAAEARQIGIGEPSLSCLVS